MKQQLLIKLAKDVTGFTNQALATWLKISLPSVKAYQRNQFNIDGSKNDSFRPMPEQLKDHILAKLRLAEIDKEF